MTPLSIGVATLLSRAAVAGGETLDAEFVTSMRGILLPMGESGILDELGEPEHEITIPVSSEAIRSIGYSVGGVITVEFVRGGTYHYPGTPEMFLAFAVAPSKGRWFNEHLR